MLEGNNTREIFLRVMCWSSFSPYFGACWLFAHLQFSWHRKSHLSFIVPSRSFFDKACFSRFEFLNSSIVFAESLGMKTSCVNNGTIMLTSPGTLGQKTKLALISHSRVVLNLWICFSFFLLRSLQTKEIFATEKVKKRTQDGRRMCLQRG